CFRAKSPSLVRSEHEPFEPFMNHLSCLRVLSLQIVGCTLYEFFGHSATIYGTAGIFMARLVA
ncbi:MAG: hypothetical protein L6406_20185, partial [Desulfobacterales bacterium]|nr:hypothetical protein [Desulfobacterales bacterium]